MVERYYNKVNTYKFQNYTNVKKKTMKTIELKHNYQNLVNVLI